MKYKDVAATEGYIISSGSEIVLRKGSNYLKLKKVVKGKRVNIKLVPETTMEAAREFKEIGVAQGMDLFHCVFLCAKNTKNFYERFAAYSIGKPDKKFNASVTFYEKKAA